MYVFQWHVSSPSAQAIYRLLWTFDVFTSQLTHVPPGDASVPAEPDFVGPLGVPSFTHQHSELTHEWPGLSFLCYQLAHGATFHGLTGDGLRSQCQPTVELAHELCQ